MKISWWLAKKYFSQQSTKTSDENIFINFFLLCLSFFSFSRKKIHKNYQKLVESLLPKSFIKLLIYLSISGITIGTTSLIIVLSTFNGLHEWTLKLYETHSPSLLVTPNKGKFFAIDSLKIEEIRMLDGVEYVCETVEDNVLVKYLDQQKTVKLKGIDHNYFKGYRLDTLIKVGAKNFDSNNLSSAIVGSGIQYGLSVNIKDPFTPLEVWYPKRGKKLHLDPARAFVQKNIMPGGVFVIEPSFDENYIFAPISFVEKLTGIDDRRSTLEILIDTDKSIDMIRSKVASILGQSFKVQTLEEQHASILKALKTERLFSFLALCTLIGLLSFNIFFSLILMVVQKQKEIKILFSLGIKKYQIQKLFLYEGFIIGFIGVLVGLFLGILLAFLQQKYHLVKLGVADTIIDAYPIKVVGTDLVFTSLSVLFICLLASLIPAKKAGDIEKLTIT